MGNTICLPEVTLAVVDPAASSLAHYNGVYKVKWSQWPTWDTQPEGYSLGWWWETDDGENAMWWGRSEDLGTKGKF